MKKKILSVVAIGALLLSGLTALSACNNGNNSKGDSINQKTSFQVTYTANADYEVTGLKESYTEGETVTFKINLKNNLKQIASVKVMRKRIRANDQGEYSFEMPADNVSIDIELADVDLPELFAFYTGNTMVGETLSFTTKIDFADNADFTIAAKTGANLVTINGHQVQLLAVGTVVLEISATKDGQNLKTSVTLDIFENEAGLGTNIAYHTKEVKSGAESLASSFAGTWISWAGDGGSISSFAYNATSGHYELSYSAGWAFYSVQLFYALPYAQANDSYKVRWEVESDAAGIVQINGRQVNLKQGSNLLGFDVTQGNGATISMQMGYMNGSEHTPLTDGTSLKFKPVRIYDTDTTHNYNHVTFSLDGTVLRDIYVREGQKVEAPEVAAQQGKVFTGFFDGDAEFDASVAPTKDANYTAKYVAKTMENTCEVTLMLGSNELTKLDVFKGKKLIIPGDLKYGFGQKLKGLYRDSAFTQAFSLDSAISEDLVLYVKTQVDFESTYVNDGGLGYQIPSSWKTYNDDGSITLSFLGWGRTDKWHIQANFTDSLIRGQLGESYTITFVYSINQEGADAQVYDGNTLDMANLNVGERQTASVTYEGGEHAGDFKLTFEFGSIDLDAAVVFTLHSIAIAKN